MKKVLKIIVALMFMISYSCKAQQLVETTADVDKLKANEQQFINKPLKLLLQEIKPKIKSAWVTNEEGYSYFSFKYTTIEERKKNIGSREDKVSLYVYVNGQVEWDYEKRPKGQELNWTKDDVEKYGNLIVRRIKIIHPKE